jgi:hypothetical protein
MAPTTFCVNTQDHLFFLENGLGGKGNVPDGTGPGGKEDPAIGSEIGPDGKGDVGDAAPPAPGPAPGSVEGGDKDSGDTGDTGGNDIPDDGEAISDGGSPTGTVATFTLAVELGVAALADYDPVAFKAALLTASGLDADSAASATTETTLLQTMALYGVSTVDADTTVHLASFFADAIGIPPSHVEVAVEEDSANDGAGAENTEDGKGKRRSRSLGGSDAAASVTVGMRAIIPDGVSVADVAALASGNAAASAVAAELALVGVDASVVVEVTGLAVEMIATVTVEDGGVVPTLESDGVVVAAVLVAVLADNHGVEWGADAIVVSAVVEIGTAAPTASIPASTTKPDVTAPSSDGDSDGDVAPVDGPADSSGSPGSNGSNGPTPVTKSPTAAPPVQDSDGDLDTPDSEPAGPAPVTLSPTAAAAQDDGKGAEDAAGPSGPDDGVGSPAMPPGPAMSTKSPTSTPSEATEADDGDSGGGKPAEGGSSEPSKDVPTAAPTASPIASPTAAPTAAPTTAPSTAPSSTPSSAPPGKGSGSSDDSEGPDSDPAPPASPADEGVPTAAPTPSPTASPTALPTAAPTSAPSATPANAPSVAPTAAPPTAPPVADGGGGKGGGKGRRRQLQFDAKEEEACSLFSSCGACNGSPKACSEKVECELDLSSFECFDGDGGAAGAMEVSDKCDEVSMGKCSAEMLADTICALPCDVPECGYDNGNCPDTAKFFDYTCASNCFCSMLSNGVCDPECKNQGCGFDLGDCCVPLFTGEYSVSFALWKQSANNSAYPVERLTPDPLIPRERYVAVKNQMIAGILLVQNRHKATPCDSGLTAFQDSCVSGEASKEPFGADPVFLRTSSLNVDADIFLSKNDVYTEAFEVSALGKPYGFHYSEAVGGFPMFFDVNLDSQRADEFVRYAKEGFFLDAETTSLTMYMVTYNPVMKLFGNIEVGFIFEPGGSILLKESVTTFRVDLLDDQVRLGLEVLFFALTLCNLVSELIDWRKDYLHTKNVFHHFMSFWNIIDAANIAVYLYGAYLWTTFLLLHVDEYDPEERYNVYRNLHADAKYLDDDQVEMERMYDFFRTTHKLSEIMMEYMYVNGLCLILIILRTLQMLDFQKRMGLVTRTIQNAFSDLMHFGILFILVISCYAFMGFHMFGSTIIEFSTPEASYHTIVDLMFGDLASKGALFQHQNRTTALLFYYTFMMFVTIILMNVLLAIIVEAYMDVKKGTAHSMSLPGEILQMVKTAVYNIPTFRLNHMVYMSDEEILDYTAKLVVAQRMMANEAKIGHRAFFTEGFYASKEELKAVIASELKTVKQITEDAKEEREKTSKSWSAANYLQKTLHQSEWGHRRNSISPVGSQETPEEVAHKIAMNILHRYGKGDELAEEDNGGIHGSRKVSVAAIAHLLKMPGLLSHRMRSSKKHSQKLHSQKVHVDTSQSPTE